MLAFGYIDFCVFQYDNQRHLVQCKKRKPLFVYQQRRYQSKKAKFQQIRSRTMNFVYAFFLLDCLDWSGQYWHQLFDRICVKMSSSNEMQSCKSERCMRFIVDKKISISTWTLEEKRMRNRSANRPPDYSFNFFCRIDQRLFKWSLQSCLSKRSHQFFGIDNFIGISNGLIGSVSNFHFFFF